ncbi:MAG: site-specific integrase [Candidatus Dormibacteria bacterium]
MAPTSTRRVPRRTRGTGSVSKRRDDLWEGRLDLGWEDGKRQHLSVYGKTKLQAEDKLDEARHRRKMGRGPGPVAITLERHLADWLARAELRPSTLRRYQAICQNQLVPKLGRVRLNELQTSDVDRMLASLRTKPSIRTGKPQSPYTVTHTRSVLRAALSDAEKNGLVERNVAKLATAPHLPKITPAVLTPGAVALVLGACESGLRRLVIVAIDTGLRQGEQLGLRWTDVDFDQRCLYVRTTLERVTDSYLLGEPKSDTSRRSLALSAVALKALSLDPPVREG